MTDQVHGDHTTTQQATNESSAAAAVQNAQSSAAAVWNGLFTPAFVRGFCALGLALVLGDLVTTVYGLEIGLRERNPFVLAALGRFGVAGLVALKLVAVSWVAVIWWILGRRYGLAAMAGLMIPQGIAVVLNVLTILNA